MWTLRVKIKFRGSLKGKIVPRMDTGSKTKQTKESKTRKQTNDNNKKGNFLPNHHLPLSLTTLKELACAILILEDMINVWLSNPFKLKCTEN